jgi:hypothetical protein
VAELADAGATTVVLVPAGDESSVEAYLDEVATIAAGHGSRPRM